MKCYRLTFADGRVGLMVRGDGYVPSTGSMYVIQGGKILRISEAPDGALDLCEAIEVFQFGPSYIQKIYDSSTGSMYVFQGGKVRRIS